MPTRKTEGRGGEVRVMAKGRVQDRPRPCGRPRGGEEREAVSPNLGGVDEPKKRGHRSGWRRKKVLGNRYPSWTDGSSATEKHWRRADEESRDTFRLKLDANTNTHIRNHGRDACTQHRIFTACPSMKGQGGGMRARGRKPSNAVVHSA